MTSVHGTGCQMHVYAVGLMGGKVLCADDLDWFFQFFGNTFILVSPGSSYMDYCFFIFNRAFTESRVFSVVSMNISDLKSQREV